VTGFEHVEGDCANYVMAWRFWGKRLSPKGLKGASESTLILASLRESTPVMETFWRRQG